MLANASRLKTAGSWDIFTYASCSQRKLWAPSFASWSVLENLGAKPMARRVATLCHWFLNFRLGRWVGIKIFRCLYVQGSFANCICHEFAVETCFIAYIELAQVHESPCHQSWTALFNRGSQGCRRQSSCSLRVVSSFF